MEAAVQNKPDEKDSEEKQLEKKNKKEIKEDNDKKKDDKEKNDKPEKNKEEKKKSEKNKQKVSNTISESGRVLPPQKEIRASEMKEDKGGSRFPTYRGYVLALAGSNYTVMACGVGHNEGQGMPPRDVTYAINDTTLMASHGFHNDVIYFNRDMQEKIDQCVKTLGKQMSLLGTAGIAKALLYNRRFFTFFKCNILAGLDQHGGGGIYVFDTMGGFKREAFAAGGSSSVVMQKLLAAKINLQNPRSVQVPQTEAEAADIITDVFRVAAEKKIFIGHAVVIHTITETGTVEEFRRVTK